MAYRTRKARREARQLFWAWVALLVGPRVVVLVVKDHGLKRTWVLVIDAR
jgi:hypothetical protein